MKKIFRKMIGFHIAIPFYIMILIFSAFIGRQKAIEFWGPVVTFVVKIIAEIFFVPKVNSPVEFDTFVGKMKLLFSEEEPGIVTAFGMKPALAET